MQWGKASYNQGDEQGSTVHNLRFQKSTDRSMPWLDYKNTMELSTQISTSHFEEK